MAAEDILADATWLNISWRSGIKGKLKPRSVAVRVRVADGPLQRIKGTSQQHLPGEKAWPIGEHRMSGEKKCYVANLRAQTDLRLGGHHHVARWVCEQAHRQLKQELALDQFEGRYWQGPHRHEDMTMIACAFLQRHPADEPAGGHPVMQRLICRHQV
jgi:SRSO17 transposase